MLQVALEMTGYRWNLKDMLHLTHLPMEHLLKEYSGSKKDFNQERLILAIRLQLIRRAWMCAARRINWIGYLHCEFRPSCINWRHPLMYKMPTHKSRSLA